MPEQKQEESRAEEVRQEERGGTLCHWLNGYSKEEISLVAEFSTNGHQLRPSLKYTKLIHAEHVKILNMQTCMTTNWLLKAYR